MSNSYVVLSVGQIYQDGALALTGGQQKKIPDSLTVLVSEITARVNSTC